MTSRCPRKSDARQTTYSYDSRGNRTGLTLGGTTTTLAYDQANRLTSYASAGTYTYNGDGLRTSKTVSGTTTNFTWDAASSLPLLLADGTNNFLYGPDGHVVEHLDGSGAATIYHHDQLGSTRLLTNTSGTVGATFNYDPYGNPTASTGTATTPFRWAGEYRDSETGLIYLRARYYEPASSQFLSRDPIAAVTQAPYSYAADDPLNNDDPTGLYCLTGKNENGSCRSLSRGAGRVARRAAKPVAETTAIVGVGLCFATGVCETALGAVAVTSAVVGTAVVASGYENHILGCDRNVRGFAVDTAITVGGAVLGGGVGHAVGSAMEEMGAEQEVIRYGRFFVDAAGAAAGEFVGYLVHR